MKKLISALCIAVLSVSTFAFSVSAANVPIKVKAPSDATTSSKGMQVHSDGRHEVALVFDDQFTDATPNYAGLWVTHVESDTFEDGNGNKYKGFGKYIYVNGVNLGGDTAKEATTDAWKFMIHYEAIASPGAPVSNTLRIYSQAGNSYGFDETKKNTIIINKDFPVFDSTLGSNYIFTYDPSSHTWSSDVYNGEMPTTGANATTDSQTTGNSAATAVTSTKAASTAATTTQAANANTTSTGTAEGGHSGLIAALIIVAVLMAGGAVALVIVKKKRDQSRLEK